MKTFGFQWHITNRCNLRCRHCYQNDFTAQTEKPLQALKDMADRIFSAIPERPVSINLTGGEPLLVEKLFELIEYLHGYQNLQEIHIITNGTLAHDAPLEAMEHFPKIKYLKVSLESAEESVNDSIRGTGNLNQVQRNLERFRAKTHKEIILMATLATTNLRSIGQSIEFARSHGVSGIIFERFVPLGNGQALANEVLSAAQWKQAIASIVKEAQVDADLDALLPFRAFWLWTEPGRENQLEGALCNLGDESMALMPDGTVYPCRRLPLPLGNVLSDSFLDLLGKLQAFSSASLKDKLSGNCCGYCGIEHCVGCRALALALRGDVLADDPQCWLQPEVDP